MKITSKIKLLQLLGLSFTTAPIITYLIVNWDKYTAVVPGQIVPESIKLSAGMVVGLTIALLTTVGKVKISGGWLFLGIMFGLSWALQSIIDDLVLFLGMAFTGSTLDYIFIKGKVADLKETRVMQKQSTINANAMAEVFTKIYSGRV
ncbi:MAG: hypothetical protein EOM29_10685 [Bacteroidia bacterium]|nr:hypothetical protein [Bacteroidia bacterium]